MTSRILLFAATLILVPLLTYFVILFARGYRPLPGSGTTLQPTGILAATSLPEGAELYINGQFRSATDTTMNLVPGTYEVEIRKETYHPWKKTLEIKAEEVTRAQALLFPTVPTFKSITTTGASWPALSPDGTKVAFLSTSQLYILDLNESPLGLLNRDPKLIFNFQFSIFNLIWGPDSKQILALATGSATLIDINQQSARLIASPSGQLARWNELVATRERQKFGTLPLQLQNIMATAAADLIWSPKENKLLYTATASATIPDELIRHLPGSSTQPQKRNLEPGEVYVYDLEEDRNFAAGSHPRGGVAPAAHPRGEANTGLSWFPTSSHLIKIEQGKVTIMEYDGGNPTVVYSGPMSGFAGPYPSSRQLLILANLDPKINEPPNLYAVSLR